MNKTLIAVLVGIPVAFGGAVLAAAPAQASLEFSPAMVQFQSYQRASQTEACVHQPWETKWQSDWSAADYDWTPSWAQWANGGTGGWVCNRSITWIQGELLIG